MRIAVDAMGGDFAPREIVKGAVQAAESGAQVLLVGDEARVEEEFRTLGLPRNGIDIVHAAEVIPMGEHTQQAVRRRGSSIAVACDLVKSGEAQGMFSAGNTAATMALCKIRIGAIPGIARPAIATVLPTRTGLIVILDVGANVDCSATNLIQFALMGSVYAEAVLGIAHPRVGLLSIGEEEGKGNELTRAAYDVIAESGLNFKGNVEGRAIFSGEFDVVVCDGFAGNVVLKVSEGVAEMTMGAIKEEARRSILNRVPMRQLRGVFARVRNRMDYAEYGGAPLLGVRGVSIIGHGRSHARAVANAVIKARQTVEGDVVGRIARSPLIAELGENRTPAGAQMREAL